MAGNLYATITKAAILSAGLMGNAYAKDAAKEQPQNFLDSKLDILDAVSGEPVKQEQTYKGTFSVPVQLDITKTPLTPFPLTYAPHLCIFSEDAVKDNSLDDDTPIACQDIAAKTYATAKDLEGVENKDIAFKDLGDVVEGRYAIASQGTMNGKPENKVTMTYFVVEAEAVAANQDAAAKVKQPEPFNYNRFPLELEVGRYKASKFFPNRKYLPLEGRSTTMDENKNPSPALPVAGWSHNFEFETFPTPNFATLFPKEEGKIYREALFAIHGEIPMSGDGKRAIEDRDHDVDIWQKRGAVTELEFKKSYEVKQHAERNGVGRSFVRVYPEEPSTVEFAGQTFTVNQPNTFYQVKVAYLDVDGDGHYKGGTDTPLDLDALVVDIHNNSPNWLLIAGGAVLGGLVTGYVVHEFLDNDDNGSGGVGGITHPNSTDDCPEESTGTFRDGDSGTGVERRRK